jgi:hypothetical protein
MSGPRRWQSLDLDAATAPLLVIDPVKGDTRPRHPVRRRAARAQDRVLLPADEATEQALTSQIFRS